MTNFQWWINFSLYLCIFISFLYTFSPLGLYALIINTNREGNTNYTNLKISISVQISNQVFQISRPSFLIPCSSSLVPRSYSLPSHLLVGFGHLHFWHVPRQYCCCTAWLCPSILELCSKLKPYPSQPQGNVVLSKEKPQVVETNDSAGWPKFARRLGTNQTKALKMISASTMMKKSCHFGISIF